MDKRQQEIAQWLSALPEFANGGLHPLAGDASFRRYFRLNTAKQTYIVMDAPPDRESCGPFIAVARSFAKAGVPVPEVIAQNVSQGFIVLTDLGDELLLNALNPESSSYWYPRALEILLDIQACVTFENWHLPVLDGDFMSMELQRYRDWYITQLCQHRLSPTEQRGLNEVLAHLVHVLQQQPQVCVHRDYHSRNLMITGQDSLGVLDFQDAMWGPLTYDVVSLLRDCYISWPTTLVHSWALTYKQMLHAAHRFKGMSDEEYLRWFDYMGVQRHLKCLGIFARLSLRDDKKAYLNDIPRILNYLEDTCARYPGLDPLLNYLPLVPTHKNH